MYVSDVDREASSMLQPRSANVNRPKPISGIMSPVSYVSILNTLTLRI